MSGGFDDVALLLIHGFFRRNPELIGEFDLVDGKLHVTIWNPTKTKILKNFEIPREKQLLAINKFKELLL